jgi:hypothetical protein
MTIDPKWRFIIGLAVTFAIGVSSGAVALTNAIPADWIKPAVAWCGIVGFLGSAAQTAISGLGMSSQSRLAAAATLPEVKRIVTTQDVADVTPSEKVVGPPIGTGTK